MVSSKAYCKDRRRVSQDLSRKPRPADVSSNGKVPSGFPHDRAITGAARELRGDMLRTLGDAALPSDLTLIDVIVSVWRNAQLVAVVLETNGSVVLNGKSGTVTTPKILDTHISLANCLGRLLKQFDARCAKLSPRRGKAKKGEQNIISRIQQRTSGASDVAVEESLVG